jgi:preprotein translocase subunit SecB
MQALLNINDYVVEELTVKGNGDYKKPAKEQEGQIDISFNARRKGKEPLFMITMTIELNKSKQAFANNAYYVFLKINGFFGFPKETGEETMQKMISLNGLVMLYGIARGVVAQATANGAHGKFVLPAVNFVELIKTGSITKSEPKRKKGAKAPTA